MTSIADLIDQNREYLLQHYLEEASQLPSARGVPPQQVIDNLPEYLDSLSALLRRQHGDPGYTRRCLEERHLGLRRRQGYTLEDVRAEFLLLGRLLSNLWESLPPSQHPPPEDTQLLSHGIQAAVEHTVSVFGEHSRRLIPPDFDEKRLGEEPLRRAIEATGLGYCQDITERKNRDKEREQFLREQTLLREQAERALRQNQRAEEVLEHGDPFILLDRDFRIIQVNKNQEFVSKKPRQETLGRIIWDVFPAIQNPESAYWREYHRAMKERVPVQFEEYYPPQELWASVNAYPTSEGGLAIFLRDVTERKRAEQFRERLVGIVSHDLRSPLNSITLAAEMLLRRQNVPEPVLAPVRRIFQSADRMSRMITDLLDFTRARLGGGISLVRRPGEFVGLVRTTLEEFEMTNPGLIVFSHGQGPYSGEWDLDRLAQVVSNLVGNALKHGAANTPVEVTLHEEGREIILAVTNQGPPIPETLLPHVFDPFRRAADSSRQGLGLGLYIAQQIVLAHGGSITAGSSTATGTTFTVRLPYGPTPTS